MAQFAYVGGELDLFARAVNWKAYWQSLVRPYLAGDVLEVGAGIGTNTIALVGPTSSRWVCLEPDHALARRLTAGIRGTPAEGRVAVRVGTLADVEPDARFDAILYIDVLEHIADDACEVRAALDRLRPGGRLIVLAPAHRWLFSPFDEAVGHYRRYTTTSMRRLFPASGVLERLIYLDAVGLAASLANRVISRQRYPTLRQVTFWDRVLVTASRRLDPLLGRKVGKSVLAVYRRPGLGAEPGGGARGVAAGPETAAP